MRVGMGLPFSLCSGGEGRCLRRVCCFSPCGQKRGTGSFKFTYFPRERHLYFQMEVLLPGPGLPLGLAYQLLSAVALPSTSLLLPRFRSGPLWEAHMLPSFLTAE